VVPTSILCSVRQRFGNSELLLTHTASVMVTVCVWWRACLSSLGEAAGSSSIAITISLVRHARTSAFVLTYGKAIVYFAGTGTFSVSEKHGTGTVWLRLRCGFMAVYTRVGSLPGAVFDTFVGEFLVGWRVIAIVESRVESRRRVHIAGASTHTRFVWVVVERVMQARMQGQAEPAGNDTERHRATPSDTERHGARRSRSKLPAASLR
jgi:hypothetical protein